MINKNSIYRLINIHESESPIVFRLLGIQFALGLATSFLVTASYTLFLHNYPISKAPLVYLLAAFVLFPINALYARLDLKLNSKRLLQVVILFAGISMAALLALWSVTRIGWIALLLVAWNLMLYMVVGYGYWGLASLLFNVRESRRIFSVIGAGDLPAKIIGYLCVSLLAPVAGVEFIMAFAVVFFILAFFLCKKLFGHSAINWEEYENQQHHVEHDKVKSWWMRLFENRLIQWIALLSLISYIIFLLIDFTFLSEIKVRYTSAHELAAFISLFFAAGRLVSIFFKVLFTSRLITRLGITRSLAITPLLILIITIGVMLVPMADPSGSTYLYAFGVMTLFSEVLRSTIQEPVFFILFQPMNIHLRLKGHLVAKGYVYPPALTVVGIGLMVWLYIEDSVPLSATLWIVCGLLVLWLLVILRIKKHYFDVVQHSIQRDFFSGISLFLNDDSVIKTLLQKTRTGQVRDRIHALTLLEKSNYKELEALYNELLQDNDHDLTLFLMERIQAHNYRSSVPVIHSLLENSHDEVVKKEAFKTLCMLDAHFLENKLTHWNEMSPELRQMLLISMAQQAKEGVQHPQLTSHMHQLAGSDAEQDQLLLLKLLQTNPSAATNEILVSFTEKTLLPTVKNKLLETAGMLHLESLIPEMLGSLKDPVYKISAGQALSSIKDVLFDHPRQFENLEADQHKILVEIAANTKTESASEYLLSLFHTEKTDPTLLTLALWDQHYSTTPGGNPIITRQVERLLASVAVKTELWQHIDADSHPELLRAVDSELKTDTLQMMRLLAMEYGREKLGRVIELMDMEQYDKMHNAIELLELSLPRHIFQELGPVLDSMIQQKQHVPDDRQNFAGIAETILKNATSFNAWTRSLTWYLAGKEAGNKLLPKLAAIPDLGDSPVVNETKAFVIFNHNHKSN